MAESTSSVTNNTQSCASPGVSKSPKTVAINEVTYENRFTRVQQYWEKVESESDAERGAQSAVELRSGYSSCGGSATKQKKTKRRWSYRDSLSSRSRRKPGSRRWKRWMNDVILGRRPEDLYDTGPINEDHSPFFEDILARSPITKLLRDDDLLEHWKQLIDINEEDQSLILRQIIDDEGDDADDEDDDYFNPRNLSAQQRFLKIDKDTKKLLRKYTGSTFLLQLDSLLLAFLQQTALLAESEFFQYKLLFCENESQLHMTMKDSLHRLLVHGICKYYDLVSQTKENKDDGKMVVVSKKPFTPIPHQSLVTYLVEQYDNYDDCDDRRRFFSSILPSSKNNQKQSQPRSSKSKKHRHSHTATSTPKLKREKPDY